MADDLDLTGKLLIAMPGMGDPRFAHSVVYLCAHSSDGAMGLIINKATDELQLADLLKQLNIETSDETRNIKVHFGGPVEHGRGFVLHEHGYHSAISTMTVDQEFSMTATLDILEDFAEGRGPGKALVALGYAGWGPGQLEMELGRNDWLTTEASHKLVFECDDPDKWEAALESLGVSALMLSADAGRA